MGRSFLIPGRVPNLANNFETRSSLRWTASSYSRSERVIVSPRARITRLGSNCRPLDLHADFISGHITLAKRKGADIVYGPDVETSFNILSAKDGQEFKIGDITIHAIHTPGHTLESTTYLLKDENGDEYAIFTGDTLFIGDVGRPDLSQNSEVDSRYLAGLLYDSLRNKIMTLDDKIIIYDN